MKPYVRISLFLCLFIFIRVSVCSAEMAFSTGIRTDIFTDDRSPKTMAHEITAPLGFSWRRNQLLMLLETAYSSAHVYAENESSNLSSLTDTRFSASYGLLNLPVGIIFGLDMNLPTGKATLTERERWAEIGENGDLFEVDNFGEGWNFGPNIGVAKEFGSVGVGGNLAYLFRGEYDPSADIPDDNLGPGDQALLLGYLKWQAAARTLLDGFLSYTVFTEDTINGEESFQEGDKFGIGLNVQSTYKALSIAVRFQQAIQGKNKELGLDNRLVAEPENSNGTESFGLLDMMYKYSPTFNFRVLGDVRYYAESDRMDELKKLPFQGKRIRYAAGVGFIYNIDLHLSLNGLVKYFVLDKAKALYLSEDTSFQGTNLSLGLTYRL